MLLSNPKIDFTSVTRVRNAKLGGQAQDTATTNTMATSASLQDISSQNAKKFNWNNNTNNNNNSNNNNNNNNINNKDQREHNIYPKRTSSNSDRHLNTSHSDERIFEHPEVTIVSSALDNEIQRRLSSMKSSNTTENLLERDGGKSVPNILEHPDMRSPVVMQTPPMSSSASSASFLLSNNLKKVTRTQSTDACTDTDKRRTPSPSIRVEVFTGSQENSSRSSSPSSFVGDSIELVEQQQDENHQASSLSATTDSIREHSEPSLISDINTIKTEQKDFW